MIESWFARAPGQPISVAATRPTSSDRLSRAIVRLTHRLDRDERRAQPIPVALERATQDLSEAA